MVSDIPSIHEFLSVNGFHIEKDSTDTRVHATRMRGDVRETRIVWAPLMSAAPIARGQLDAVRQRVLDELWATPGGDLQSRGGS